MGSSTTPVASGTTVSYTWTDNGTYPVTLKVIDAQGGEGTKTFDVTVNNVAPTATFNAPVSVNEGSDISLSLTDPVDPGSLDTFTYSFSCDQITYTAYSSTNIYVCPTTDKGTAHVGGIIQDNDGGTTPYTADVTINDVLPTAVNAHGTYNGIAGQTSIINRFGHMRVGGYLHIQLGSG